VCARAQWSSTGDKLLTGSYGGVIASWSGKCFEYDSRVEVRFRQIARTCRRERERTVTAHATSWGL
jgi:hypothetical protein